eukprot:GFUD01024437.1.p1 GENE.GFUD01024437.1~~GFUD01024437.1.p1  ORF type:complete len:333 (+),score=41.31 GFUD01024437.1:81-1079(+)
MMVHLPLEILVQIFRNLCHDDLKIVFLVSKYWKVAAEDKTLWRNFNLNIKLRLHCDAWKLLESERFSLLENLSLEGLYNASDIELDNANLKLISQLKLKHLRLSKISLRKTDPKLFARVLNRMETVDLTNIANSSKDHFEAFFNLFAAGSSRLDKLRLDNWTGFDASEIEPEVVGKAFNQLEELEVNSTKIGEEQLRSLFRNMNGETNLRMVSFWGLNLSRIDPHIFAGAVHKMQVAKVRDAQLTTTQIEQILTRVVDISSLRVLDIRNNEKTRYVNADLKTEALRILESFDYDTWKPSVQQEVSTWKSVCMLVRFVFSNEGLVIDPFNAGL